jgi:hypothetical protein
VATTRTTSAIAAVVCLDDLDVVVVVTKILEKVEDSGRSCIGNGDDCQSQQKPREQSPGR